MIFRRHPVALIASLALVVLVSTNAQSAEPAVRKDLYDDPLPEGAIARLGSIRWRAQDDISHMAFVPGSHLLATTDGHTLSLWDMETGRVARTISTGPTFGTKGELVGDGFGHFAYTPDGKYLLSVDTVGAPIRNQTDGKSSLILWDAATDKQVMKKEIGNMPVHLAIRPDGLFAACVNDMGDIHIWDLQKNKIRRVFKGDGRMDIEDLVFVAEGKRLVALSSRNNRCLQFNVVSGKLLRKTGLEAYGRIALAPQTGMLATYNTDELCLHDTRSGAKRRLTLPEKTGFLDLSFSIDGATLLALDRENEEVQFWNVAQGKLLRRLHVAGVAKTYGYAKLLLSADGTTLASYEENRLVRIWDARTGEARGLQPDHVYPPSDIVFSADGKEVVSYGAGKVLRWDGTTGKPLQSFSPETPPGWVQERHMDRRLAPRGRHLIDRYDGVVYLHDTGTGKRTTLESEHLVYPEWTITDDGRVLATVGKNSTIYLWDVGTGKILRTLELDKKDIPIYWLQFTADGKTLVTGEGWNKVHLWDVATGKHRATLTAAAERDPVPLVMHSYRTTITPDGRYLFVSSRNMSPCIWDLVECREIGPFKGDDDERAITTSEVVAVSPDGRYVAWFNEDLQLVLYEVGSGIIVHRFEEGFSSIAFAPSGLRLATGCESDASILIWDLPQLLRGQPSPGKVPRPESLWVALGSGDGSVAEQALWRLTPLDDTDAFLDRHLRPVVALTPDQVRALLNDLGDEEFDKRQRSERALEAGGEAVRATLLKELTSSIDLEVRCRVERLLALLSPGAPERLREVRAVHILEVRGTAAARRLLQKLAGGVPEARLTKEAETL